MANGASRALASPIPWNVTSRGTRGAASAAASAAVIDWACTMSGRSSRMSRRSARVHSGSVPGARKRGESTWVRIPSRRSRGAWLPRTP
jgi:hypothetical protein